ncbi:LysR family transcriptional regulator [Paenibacillus piri]|uniref:LysR family transcriptional regulator n=1 Tax=Paenibacillus piri TaxID=2547395 RepID=A0A4R5KDB8_9BACL|nr:LysR family transcriptional regulator [Paenibacillus piri]TDF92508.1 LysR family transcriptional regulator [Paenibacillus piri]
MDWFDLHAFITVAREKSISKASQILHVSQPTLTARLKRLEQELGVYLLERNWKGIELNRLGALFLIRAIKIKQEMNESITLLQKLGQHYEGEESTDDTSGERKPGKLTIGISRPLCASFVTPILLEMNRNYPMLRCNIISEFTDYILDLAAVGAIDIGIVPHTENRPELISVPIFKDEMLLLGPKQDETIGESFTNAGLLHKPFILFDSRFSLRKLADTILTSLWGDLPRDIQEVNDLGALLSMVSNGMGYSLLPASYILQLESHAPFPFQLLKLGPRFPIRHIHMVYSASIQSDPAIQNIAQTIASPYQRMMT